jgi:hypothetical protein
LRVVDLHGAVMRPFSLPFRRVRRCNQLAAGRIDQRRCAQPLSDRGVENQLDARSDPSGGVGRAGFFSAEHDRNDVGNLDLVEAEPANDREGEFGQRIPPARLRVAVLPRGAVSLKIGFSHLLERDRLLGS